MCTELPGIPLCGHHGSCVSNVCECEDDWSNSEEWAFYADKNNSLGLPCTSHQGFINALYILSVVVTVFVIFCYIFAVQKRKQLFRLIPFVGGTSLHIAYSVLYVASNGEEAFPTSAAYTFLFAIAFLGTNISMLVFFNKYISFHAKTLPVMDEDMNRGLKLVQRVHVILITADFIIAFFWISLAFVETGKLVIIKVSFGILFCRSISVLWLAFTLLNKLVSCFKICLTSISRADSKDSESFQAEIRASIPRIRVLKIVFTIYFFMMSAFTLLAVAWTPWLDAWKYFVPLHLLIGQGVAMTTLWLNLQSRKHRTSSKSAQDKRISKEQVSKDTEKPFTSTTKITGVDY